MCPSFQAHAAVSRVTEITERTEEESFPSEALKEHGNIYSCVSCGYHPKTVIVDLPKKGVFSMPSNKVANLS